MKGNLVYRYESILFMVSVLCVFIVFACFLFCIFKMPVLMLCSLHNESLLVFQWGQTYNIVFENNIKTTILLFIVIVTGTICCPSQFVIVTGLRVIVKILKEPLTWRTVILNILARYNKGELLLVGIENVSGYIQSYYLMTHPLFFSEG